MKYLQKRNNTYYYRRRVVELSTVKVKTSVYTGYANTGLLSNGNIELHEPKED